MSLKRTTFYLTPTTVIKETEKGLFDYLTIVFGFWIHPFLTINHLVKKTTLSSSFWSFLTTLIFLWLAQLILHPQPLGVIQRLIIWQQLAWIVSLGGIIILILALVDSNNWRQILSLSFFTPLPAAWLVIRSFWLRISPSSVGDFLFLDLTLFLLFLQFLIFYLWLRFVLHQRLLTTTFLIPLAASWLYLFKQFLCLWF